MLRPLNRFWTKLGLLLHGIANPIAMGLPFLRYNLPTGLVMRLRGGDLLRLKREPDAASYWICAPAGASAVPDASPPLPNEVTSCAGTVTRARDMTNVEPLQ